MKETYYECVFKFEGEKYRTEIDGIYSVKDGFWVDQWWEYVAYSDDAAAYWIPESKIQHVEKKTRTTRKAKVQ